MINDEHARHAALVLARFGCPVIPAIGDTLLPENGFGLFESTGEGRDWPGSFLRIKLRDDDPKVFEARGIIIPPRLSGLAGFIAIRACGVPELQKPENAGRFHEAMRQLAIRSVGHKMASGKTKKDRKKRSLREERHFSSL